MIAQDQGMRQHQAGERVPGSVLEQDLVSAKGDASAGDAPGGRQDLPDGEDDRTARAEQGGRSDGPGGNVDFQASITAPELLGLPGQGDGGRGHADGPGAREGVRFDRGIRMHIVTQVDMLALGPLEPGRRRERRIGIVFGSGGLCRLDRVRPATERSGEQEETQEERQQQLAHSEARVEPPGWGHVRAIRKSAKVGRRVRSEHITPAFSTPGCQDKTTTKTPSLGQGTRGKIPDELK